MYIWPPNITDHSSYSCTTYENLSSHYPSQEPKKVFHFKSTVYQLEQSLEATFYFLLHEISQAGQSSNAQLANVRSALSQYIQNNAGDEHLFWERRRLLKSFSIGKILSYALPNLQIWEYTTSIACRVHAKATESLILRKLSFKINK